MNKKIISDNNTIKRALITSSVSKVITICIQLFSFPLAVKALGVEQFGVYVVITSLLAWFNLGSFGIFPGLTREVSKSIEDNKRTLKYIYSAMHIVTCGLCIIFFVIYFGSLLTPELLFNGEYSSLYFSKELMNVWLVSLLFVFFSLYGSIAESVRLGMKKQDKNNVINIIGNLVSFVLIIFVSYYSPTLLSFVIAVAGAQAIAKFINLLLLMLELSKNVEVHLSCFTKGNKYKELLNVGGLFFISEILGIASTQGLIFFIGQSSGPVVVSYIAFIFKFMALSGGFIVMITQPLSAVFMSLYNSLEFSGLIKKVVQYYTPLFLFTIVISICINFFGQYFFSVWSAGEVQLKDEDIMILGFYFIVVVLNHLIFTYLFSVGMTKRPIFTKMFESLSIIFVVFLFRGDLSVNNVLLYITLLGFFITSLPYLYFFLNNLLYLRKKSYLSNS